jgi:hypothetical protein
VLVGFESQSLSLHLILCIRRHSITVRQVRSADSRFGSVTFVAHDFRGRRLDFWHRMLVPSALAYEIWYFNVTADQKLIVDLHAEKHLPSPEPIAVTVVWR